MCRTDGDCPAGDVCGRYDYRGIGDSGLPEGDPSDVVSVCRPSTVQPCSVGCGAGACLTLGTPTEGLCAPRCNTVADCSNGVCLVTPGACTGLCAPPCDSLAECPRYFVCDTLHIDSGGHGRCIPVDPDAGISAGPPGDASCSVDP